jgi:hypothetical protein
MHARPNLPEQSSGPSARSRRYQWRVLACACAIYVLLILVRPGFGLVYTQTAVLAAGLTAVTAWGLAAHGERLSRFGREVLFSLLAAGVFAVYVLAVVLAVRSMATPLHNESLLWEYCQPALRVGETLRSAQGVGALVAALVLVVALVGGAALLATLLAWVSRGAERLGDGLHQLWLGSLRHEVQSLRRDRRPWSQPQPGMPCYELRSGDLFAPCNFEFGQRRRTMRAVDWAAARFLLTLALRLDLRRTAFRQDFRNILDDDAVGGLAWAIGHGGDQSKRLAVWLVGRLERRRLAWLVAPLRCSDSPAVRKEVARALRRMDAWTELATMSGDPAVRQFAVPPVRRPFADRIGSFLGHVAAGPPVGARASMPLVVNVSPLAGRPPRSAATIRRVLETIRRLVHGLRGAENGWHNGTA